MNAMSSLTHSAVPVVTPAAAAILECIHAVIRASYSKIREQKQNTFPAYIRYVPGKRQSVKSRARASYYYYIVSMSHVQEAISFLRTAFSNSISQPAVEPAPTTYVIIIHSQQLYAIAILYSAIGRYPLFHCSRFIMSNNSLKMAQNFYPRHVHSNIYELL